MRFDPGPAGSARECHSIGLFLKSTYAPQTGFGWSQRPEKDFHRRELNRSRTALTVDGVSGNRLGFRADVDPGTWHLTIWLEEPGPTEDRWPQVMVQGKRVPLLWQEFPPREEPSRHQPKIFRVFHCTVAVGTAGLSFELTSRHAPIGLLGISMIRHLSDTKSEHQTYLHRLELAGEYQNKESLANLLRETNAVAHENPSDALYAIWQQRLGFLDTATRYYAMSGWQWADDETGLGMFDRQHQAVMLLDGLLMADQVNTRPLGERALFFRGRLLYWLGKQRGGIDVNRGGRRDLEVLAKKYPDDQLLAMYCGQRVDIPDACDCLEPTANAPAWSNAQREALCRLRELVRWWVEIRQSDTGELGGKFGDDVEMLRWWAPLCLVGDEVALRGWKELADGVWQSKHIAHGYARKLADVEHAAEFVADTAPLMLLYTDDPRYELRLVPSAKYFESRWTGLTIHGNRFFRSAWFNATELETREPRGRDLEYNTRAAQALRYLAWRNQDPEHIELLHEWSKAWAGAAMRTDKGKPKGIIPASIRFVDEAFNGDGPNWYQAGMYWSYFEWEHNCGSLLLDQLLFTYSLTKDERLLQPMLLSLKLIRSEEQALSGKDLASLPKGSPAWVAANLIGCRQFWNVVEQWRAMVGDSRWDDLIMRHGTAFGRFLVRNEERHLVDGLNTLLEDVRYNAPLRSTEAIYTDRVRVPGAELVKAMLTGDGIIDNLSPYYCVSWQQTDENFTALVRNANSERVVVLVFHHGLEAREVLMRVWRLAPGEYKLLYDAPGTSLHEEIVTIEQRGQRIPVRLPSQRLLRLTLHRIAE